MGTCCSNTDRETPKTDGPKVASVTGSESGATVSATKRQTLVASRRQTSIDIEIESDTAASVISVSKEQLEERKRVTEQLRTTERLLGPRDPETLLGKMALAKLLREQGEFENANKLERAAKSGLKEAEAQQVRCKQRLRPTQCTTISAALKLLLRCLAG